VHDLCFCLREGLSITVSFSNSTFLLILTCPSPCTYTFQTQLDTHLTDHGCTNITYYLRSFTVWFLSSVPRLSPSHRSPTVITVTPNNILIILPRLPSHSECCLMSLEVFQPPPNLNRKPMPLERILPQRWRILNTCH
jgi:hypothetical protein